MKFKKGWVIIVSLLLILSATFGIFFFVAYHQTTMLRQRLNNIQYLNVIQSNYHEDSFEIMIEGQQDIEAIYEIINSTDTERVWFPDAHSTMILDTRWELYIYYQNRQEDKIDVISHGLFYRQFPTNRSGELGFIRGSNEELPALLMSIFEEQGFYERPHFHEKQISDERWNSAERIHTSNNDFTFLIGEEVYTLEKAINVANTILEIEQSNHSAEFELSFIDNYELNLVEYDKDSGIWLFSFWVNDMVSFSSSLRVAFNGATGEVIQMWIEHPVLSNQATREHHEHH